MSPPLARPLVPGRPFLQIPGPTLVPERIVRAMAEPIIDHRGTGAWEVAIVNPLSPGDRVRACINGHFGVEMTLKTFGVDIRVGAGLAAAEHYLLDTA